MTTPMFFGMDPHILREKYAIACQMADRLLKDEDDLIRHLVAIDENRFYVRFGYKSLRTFCMLALKLPKTQSQRVVTQVRRRRWASSA